MILPSLGEHATELRRRTAYNSVRVFVTVAWVFGLLCLWGPLVFWLLGFRVVAGDAAHAPAGFDFAQSLGANLFSAIAYSILLSVVCQLIRLGIDMADACLNISRHLQARKDNGSEGNQ